MGSLSCFKKEQKSIEVAALFALKQCIYSWELCGASELHIFNQTCPRDSRCELPSDFLFNWMYKTSTPVSADQRPRKNDQRTKSHLRRLSNAIKPSVGWAVAMFIHVSAIPPLFPIVVLFQTRYRATPVTVQSGDYLGFI